MTDETSRLFHEHMFDSCELFETLTLAVKYFLHIKIRFKKLEEVGYTYIKTA